jgi:predicted RNA binding protein YcfA (HicA-like mRNA interferase family)
MSKFEKIIYKIFAGQSDSNIAFTDLISLLKVLGFSERIKGSHHIFYRDGVEEILNLQPKGILSKAYQIKQVRKVIVKYKLGQKT